MTDKEKELQAEAIDYYRKQIADLKKENAELEKACDETPTLDDCEEYDFDNEYESEQFANRITRDWEHFTEYWVAPELTKEENDYLLVA